MKVGIATLVLAILAVALGSCADEGVDYRRSAAWLLLNPVTAAVLGVVVLDESLSLPQVAGAVVVLTGLGLGSGLSPALTGPPPT